MPWLKKRRNREAATFIVLLVSIISTGVWNILSEDADNEENISQPDTQNISSSKQYYPTLNQSENVQILVLNNAHVDEEFSAIWENINFSDSSELAETVSSGVYRAHAAVDELGSQAVELKRKALRKVAFRIYTTLGGNSDLGKTTFERGRITKLTFSENRSKVELVFQTNLNEQMQ